MQGSTPRGWYADPDGAPRQRYWDGSAWTHHYRDPGHGPGPAPQAVPAPPQVPPQQTQPLATAQPSQGPRAPFPATGTQVRPPVGSIPPYVAGVPPKKPSWWQQWWAIAAFAFVGLLLGVAIGAGGGSTAETTTVAGADKTDTKTITETKTVQKKAKTVTVTSPTPQPSTGGGDSENSFSGNGQKNLGTITVDEPSTLKWTNDGALFQLNDDGFDLSVSSEGESGDTKVSPGTYKEVTVNAIGNWTIEIIPD